MADKKIRRPLTNKTKLIATAHLRYLEKRVNELRKRLGLPPAVWPHYVDSLDRALHDHNGQCPFCGSQEIDASDYDGGSELTMTVTCASCGEEWHEIYRFVGAWQDEEEDE